MYNIIATGSKGNAVLYHNSILIDCGVPFSKIEPYVNSLQLVLISHVHGDHLNIATIKKLAFERPSLRFGCGKFLESELTGIRNLDIYEAGKIYNYGEFSISPIRLYHDVQNFGFRIFKGDHKTIHCTDAAHLEGVTAKDYDLYAIESNYNEETIYESIAKIEARGGFAYQKGAINTHLSEQQAADFIYKNRKESSQIIRLHESSNK